MLLIDILGWIGSIFLVGAYWLVSKNRITAQSKPYQTLNVLGSILLTINTVYYGAYPSSAVNIIWIFIGGYFLWKTFVRPNSEPA
ncbi:MAG: hypothetical protein AAGH79_04660 [Bacteroidota bacterium]